MMRKFFSVVVVLLVATVLLAADTIKSGPQVGQDVPGPFHPLNINGENANEKHCLFCQFGEGPVAMIFAREATPAVNKLAQQIEAVASKNKELSACVIFCNDEADLPKKLKEAAAKANLKKVILAIDNPAGPDGYGVAKTAEVTVLLYTDRKVVTNFAFRKGELDDKQIDLVISGLSKILPKN